MLHVSNFILLPSRFNVTRVQCNKRESSIVFPLVFLWAGRVRFGNPFFDDPSRRSETPPPDRATSSYPGRVRFFHPSDSNGVKYYYFITSGVLLCMTFVF